MADAMQQFAFDGILRYLFQRDRKSNTSSDQMQNLKLV